MSALAIGTTKVQHTRRIPHTAAAGDPSLVLRRSRPRIALRTPRSSYLYLVKTRARHGLRSSLSRARLLFQVFLREPDISARPTEFTTQLLYARRRRPGENLLAQLARHPPETRRADVIRWTEVFHRHLLLFAGCLDAMWERPISLHRMIQSIEVPPHYSSSVFTVNRENTNFFATREAYSMPILLACAVHYQAIVKTC